MISIQSSKFVYNASKKSFASEISDIAFSLFKPKESFEMISSKTGKKATFHYTNIATNDGEVIGWEYVSKPVDNPNKQTYRCIIFND